jgi:hypothetical protein
MLGEAWCGVFRVSASGSLHAEWDKRGMVLLPSSR